MASGKEGIDVGIAIDVCHCTQTPGIDKNEHGDIASGSGPVITVGPGINPKLSDLMIKVAKANNIDIQINAAGGMIGNDSQEFHDRGIPAGTIGIPCRYMHTPNEVVDMKDVMNAIILLAAVCKEIDDEMSFNLEV